MSKSLEVEIIYAQNGLNNPVILLRITKQTKKGFEYVATNGVRIRSATCPALQIRNTQEVVLYVRGIDRQNDNDLVVVPNQEILHKILAAVAEYNEQSVKMEMEIRIEQMESIPPNSNPFHHDLYNMGTILPDFGKPSNRDWCIMYDHTGAYLIIVHIATGKRIKVTGGRQNR